MNCPNCGAEWSGDGRCANCGYAPPAPASSGLTAYPALDVILGVFGGLALGATLIGIPIGIVLGVVLRKKYRNLGMGFLVASIIVGVLVLGLLAACAICTIGLGSMH